ncbi:MAG: M1 family metallopeptidase [Bacteroidota bacterium]|jgi:aminopeptidase N
MLRGLDFSIFPSFHFSISLFLLLILFYSVELSGQDFGRRERTYDVLHYRIDVRMDESARRVDGIVDVTLQPLRTSIDTVVLDAVDMDIRSVLLDDGGKSFSIEARWIYDTKYLRVILPLPLNHGEQRSIRIAYSCIPQRGLYFISPDASFPEDPRQIWTQGQGEDNRHWFPCYDFPNDKATSEILLTVDTALQTLSNGSLIGRRDNGDGSATWHWRQELAHSSYLIMLAAGKYDVFRELRDGIAVESWHYPSDDARDVRRTFDDTEVMLAFYSEYTRVRYPWTKYAQIPVRHFPYGGMENTSATVMADTRLVVDVRAALDYDPQPLIAHELAHQWFGDYVTYIDWNNEWLNEGFATFFQQLWTRQRFGEADFILQRFNGIRSYLDWADRAGRFPVVYKRRTGAANSYSKGAAVLHMLRAIVGEEEFRRVITSWLERHALGSVETNDFKRTVEDVTGRSMQWFFDQWLYKAGYPEIAVTREVTAGGDTLRLRFTQTQTVDSLCGYFRMPLALRWPGGRTETVWISGERTTTEFVIDGEEDRFLEIDPENLICGRIRVDYSLDERIRLLKDAGSPAQRILAAEALASEMKKEYVREALFAAARTDSHREVRKGVATQLANLRPDTITFGGDLKEILVLLTEDSFSGVRSTALNGLNNFRDAGSIPLFRVMLEDSSYYVEASAMNCILTVDSVGGAEVVGEHLAKESYADVLQLAAMDWVRKYRYQQFIPLLRRLAAPGHSVAVRTKSLETLLLLRDDPEALRTIILGWIDEPHAPVRAWAVSALRLFGDAEARRILIPRLPGEKNGHVRSVIRELYGL